MVLMSIMTFDLASVYDQVLMTFDLVFMVLMTFDLASVYGYQDQRGLKF